MTGEAGDWFWHYLREHESPDWERIKGALEQRFVTRGTDAEIRSLMGQRVQRRGERFDDFCREVERLSFQLRIPIREYKLLDLLMKNADEALRQVLCLHEVDTIEEMKIICQRYERLWASRDRLHRSQRKVDEIEELGDDFNRVGITSSAQRRLPQAGDVGLGYSDSDNHDRNEQDEVAALEIDRVADMFCWNCNAKGHTYPGCEATTRKIFRYGCGAKNTYKPTCPRCAGNVKRRGAVGQPRSNNPFGPKTTDRTVPQRK